MLGYGILSNQVLDTSPTALRNRSRREADLPAVGAKFSFPDQGCWQYYSGISADPSFVTDRESVINLHMGIPKANGLRDDVQVLWSGSALNNYCYNSPDDIGPGNNQFIWGAYGTRAAAPTCGPETVGPGLTVNGCSGIGQIVSFLQPNQFYLQRAGLPAGPYLCPSSILGTTACGPTYLGYADGVAYNVPFGTAIGAYNYKTGTGTVRTPGVYMVPDTPAHAFNGPIPADDNSQATIRNNAGITKLQYTYALSQSAYLRAYGYTFYSDWLQNSPIAGATGDGVPSCPPPRSTS